jgi:prepilin-type N-terminal cleavage/methylation domain-containing protein
MKTISSRRRSRQSAFTLVEVMISMSIVCTVMALSMSTFLFCMRTMYKDLQRLSTNGSLRSFMAQVSKETLNASYFYLFPHYTALDGSVDLTTDYANMDQQLPDFTDDDYDKWIAHGDCLVLVTKTSLYRTTDIRQIRIYYRNTTDQATANGESHLRYYETSDWGEGTAGDPTNGHNDLAAELNAINLSTDFAYTGSKLITERSKGRIVDPVTTGYTAGDRYPIFSTESPSQNPSTGFISLNVEFINGTTVNNMLSSSSFNYTISPRR